MTAQDSTITDDKLARLEKNPPPHPVEFSIPQIRGLRARHAQSGKINFLWIYRFNGKQRKLNLGQFKKGNRLEDVIDRLNTARARVEMGHDPQQKKENKITTVAQLADAFYKSIDPDGAQVHERGEPPDFHSTTARLKQPGTVYRLIENEIKPAIGSYKIQLVEPHMIASLIDDKAKGRNRYAGRPAPTHARRLMTVLNQMFRFAVARGILRHNPVLELRAGDMELAGKARHRHLDPGEIKVLWNALDGEHPIYRAALRLLLLTGARGHELRQARWDDVDFVTWTIPVENQKSAGRVSQPQPFIIPLHPLAKAEFRALQQQTADRGEYVLMNPGKWLKRLNACSLRHKGYDIAGRFNMVSWAPHDLRRTFRTGLTDIGVDHAIAEKCVNHSLGAMEQTYNRSNMLDQRRAALARWEERLAVYLSDDEKVTPHE